MPAARWITGASTGLRYLYDSGTVYGMLDADLAMGTSPEKVFSPTFIPLEYQEKRRRNPVKHGPWLKNNDHDDANNDPWVAYAPAPKGCDQSKCKMALRGNGARRECGLRTTDGSSPPIFGQRRMASTGNGRRNRDPFDQPPAGIKYWIEDHARSSNMGAGLIGWSHLVWIVRSGERKP